MDPQKNTSNPASNAGSPVPLSAQDDTVRPPASPPAADSQEVTVDFSQGQETTPGESSRPGGVGNMPSITPEADSPAAAADLGAAAPAGPQGQASATPPSGAPGQPLSPQAPYTNSAGPSSTTVGFPPAPSPGGTPSGQPGFGNPAGPQSTQPQPMQQPFGASPTDRGFEQPPSAVPPTVPVGGRAEKKTIIVLAGVAVLLIVAILVLVIL